jgi:tetratricopeptide (TPR) repeat protein
LSTEAVALIRTLSQPEALLYALYCMALSHLYLNNFDEVIVAAQEWGRIGEVIHDWWGQTIALNFTAVALVGQHKLAEAREKVDQALHIFSQVPGESFGMSWAALVRGRVALGLGAYAEAKPFYDRSLAAAQALDYRRTIQQSYDNLGDVAFYLGELDQAEGYFRLSLEVSEETGQTREMIGTLHDLARVWAVQGKKCEAVELLAVILHHPLSNLPLFMRTEEAVLREAAERLRSSLEGDLAPEEYKAAWGHGRTLPLEAVVAGLIHHLR